MGSMSLPASSTVLHRDLHHSPIEVVSASGLYFTCSDGRKIVDATGGAVVSCIGHGDARVQKAMTAQTQGLDYIHSMIFSCPVSEDLCKLLVYSTDGAMAKAYMLSSGR
jgi:adenosylmethionine-8-amino-7-oxononanoate aminotransferase